MLRIGANVRNSDLAAHPVVRSRLPVVARALLAGASGQIRNQATTAGNLLQRTRCVYFQDVTTPCNKREPGSGCSALEGYGRYNAILGASPACVATHPSDLAVGTGRGRRDRGGARHRTASGGSRSRTCTACPGTAPSLDTTLAARRPRSPRSSSPLADRGTRSTYTKVRDRASYAFALVSVAADAAPRRRPGGGRPDRVGRGGAQAVAGASAPRRR